MSKNKKLALLAVAAAFVILENLVFFSAQPGQLGRGDDEDDENEDEVVWEADDQRAEALARISSRQVSDWFASHPATPRNPFLTAGESGLGGPIVSSSIPRLVGTLWSHGRRVAWLDGEVRAEGEWIGEHEVRRIETDRVVVVRGGEEILLRLVPRLEQVAGDRVDEEEDDESE